MTTEIRKDFSNGDGFISLRRNPGKTFHFCGDFAGKTFSVDMEAHEVAENTTYFFTGSLPKRMIRERSR